MSHAAASHAALSADNLNLRPGSSAAPAMLLLLLGVVGLVATLGVAFAGGESDVASAQVALAAYHVGAIVTLAVSLGALAFVMILHQVNAGWAALVRRQAENAMSLMPFGVLLVAISLVLNLVLPYDLRLFGWMDAAYTAGDPIYEHKEVFLNTPFWIVRALLYMVVWLWLARSLYGMSRKQDHDGDRWWTAKMRRRSSYGLLLFAFSTAFASFDWIMSMDYHWFSTMFGVYFFAQCMGAALATVVLMMLWIRRSGRARELATPEHLHDIGKLLFGFTAFWGYIGFSQYFLIWYANIPEETSWFIRRKTEGWEFAAMALVVARFAIPFVVLMARPARRSPFVLGFMSLWILGATVFDLLFVIRGGVYGTSGIPPVIGPVDFIAALAPLLLFAGLLVRRMGAVPVAPPNDPRIDLSLHHKNYV